jgi:hypothetical protein
MANKRISCENCDCIVFDVCHIIPMQTQGYVFTEHVRLCVNGVCVELAVMFPKVLEMDPETLASTAVSKDASACKMFRNMNGSPETLWLPRIGHREDGRSGGGLRGIS